MNLEDSLQTIQRQLEAGDEEAANAIFRRFSKRLIALAASRLDRRVRGTVDPEDVMGSVMKSFFVRQQNGTIEVKDWDGVWNLLVVLTIRKCIRHSRRQMSERRDVRRVSVGNEELAAAISKEPSPLEAAILRDTIVHLMRKVKEAHREIVMLRLQGHSVAEISEQLNFSERTVHRALSRAREHLELLDLEEETNDEDPDSSSARG